MDKDQENVQDQSLTGTSPTDENLENEEREPQGEPEEASEDSFPASDSPAY